MKLFKIIMFVITAIIFAVIIAANQLYSNQKIKPGFVNDNSSIITQPDKEFLAKIETITDWYEAVGTVRPRTETRIESQIAAKIISVKVRPGQKVTKGQTLVVLDSRQFRSRVGQSKQALRKAISGKEQAKQGLIAAEAAFKQAKAAFERIKTYFQSQAATTQDLEKAESAYLQAEAEVKRNKKALIGAESGIKQAEEVVKEATIGLGYAELNAPQSGEVLKRLVEPGDMALPGKPLIILQTTGALRLEAFVREGLISKISIGDRLEVDIKALDKRFDAVVEEIVPYADPQTRTFLVKATLPTVSGIYPGMFGKLLIPASEQKVVLIPINAIQKVGQLEFVRLKEKNEWKKCYIKIGKTIGDKAEVLSGLNGNEIIGIEER